VDDEIAELIGRGHDHHRRSEPPADYRSTRPR
jgi:hypothetical protein